MSSRREFLRSVGALSGAAFARGSIPPVIARALAIDPRRGTTFRDAEHIVVLMQENRSFDHAYGALRGVRGFRDPHPHLQPDGTPVWFQRDEHGRAAAPFRLDMANTSSTWIGGLPHTWPDQIDARNDGRYDKWLVAKPREELPLALGHYARDDIPFYYALADAFTVCDQAFCSSLTGTTPNRLYLWSGTIRRDEADAARVMNEDTDYDREVAWTSFPERLEAAGVSWRIYQNEIYLDTGLGEEGEAWLANFGDNPIEWFSAFGIRFAKSRRAALPGIIAALSDRIAAEAAAREPGLADAERARREQHARALATLLENARAERARYDDAAWDALPDRARALHERAFTVNDGDANYRRLATLEYRDGGTTRDVRVPAGDVFHRFRRDVARGELPAISWLVAPQNFSDHPSAPWYGAWYVSEALNILTANPEVWRRTIFVLCYDENDGYFDHVPPFTAPHPDRPESGRASPGIDTRVEWANVHGRESSIGLGYRVPLVIASPWSRGGCVDSQVFDHTSVLRLMEVWLAAKGRPVRETNISAWRRVVCGDLTSAFRPYDGDAIPLPAPLDRDATVERIHAARFHEAPPAPPPPAAAAAAAIRNVAAQQEPGTRASCPLPYELAVDVEREDGALTLILAAHDDAFGGAAQGAPFNAYAYDGGDRMRHRAYAVRAGDAVRDRWDVGAGYHLRVQGPNGFTRSFRDDAPGTPLGVSLGHRSGRGARAVDVTLHNRGGRRLKVAVRDESYGGGARTITLAPGRTTVVSVDTGASHGWYEVSVTAGALRYRYAGRIETGEWSITDPAMGR
ncbi:MAG: phosphocholine-specific phospholipase C [Gemmatimonadaceae bacterium]